MHALRFSGYLFPGVRAALLLLMLSATGASAFTTPARERLTDIDQRPAGVISRHTNVSPSQLLAAGAMHKLLPEAQIEFDRITGAPKYIAAGPGFLTGQNGQGGAVPATALASIAADDPY